MEASPELLNLYCLADPLAFAPFVVERETELMERVRRACGPEFFVSRSGIWALVRPAIGESPERGWKLHVSLSVSHYEPALILCARGLAQLRVRFKFLAETAIHELSHSPEWSRAQSGKDIVVYPADAAEARTATEVLTRLLAPFDPGPRVLSDLPIPGSQHVFYRFGAFERHLRCEPDGSQTWLLSRESSQADARRPWYEPPHGVADPFRKGGHRGGRSNRGGRSIEGEEIVLDERYRVVSAIKFTNAGGVYRALDLVDERPVIVKEARPGVVHPRSGRSAVAMLRREHELQTDLGLGAGFAEAVAFFEQDGHAFAVQRDVGGSTHLGQWTIAHNPLYSQVGNFERYLHTYLSLIHDVARGLLTLHRLGVALGDLSFTNVVVHEDRARIVDLGAAFRPAAEDHPGTYTRGLGPTVQRSDGFERDVRSLGYLLCGGFVIPGGISELDQEAPLRMARVVADAYGGHLSLDVAERCMQASDGAASQLLDAVLAHDPRRVRLGPPGPRPRPRRPRPECQGIVEAWTRGDQDFRRSPLAFERHPGSLAWGTGGPLFVLGATGGEVPASPYERWLAAVRSESPELPPGLYPGWAGVAEIALACADPASAQWAISRAVEGCDRLTDNSYWQGLAGVAVACLDVARATHSRELEETAVELGRRAYAGYSRTPPGGKRHGLAHGAAGALLMVCQSQLWGHVVDQVAAASLAREASACLRATPPGGHLASVPDPDRPGLFRHYLNDGTAGVASALAHYYVHTRCPTTRDTLERLLPDLDRVLTATPALWTGFSGLGMALLDVASALGREDLRVAAAGMADRLRAYQTLDHPGFPGEQNLRLSDDLVAGTSGVLAFLWRIEDPHSRPNILPGFTR